MTAASHDMAGLYAVDALTPEEVQEFETHLANCFICQQEVAEMRDVTLWLSRSEAADPPDSLRTTVLGLIDSTPQDAATASEPARTATAPSAVSMLGKPRHRLDEDAEGPSADVIPLAGRRAARLSYLVAAAGVIVALVFGGWALQSRHDADQASSQRAEIINLLGATDVKVVTAAGSSGGSGTVVLSKKAGQAVFVAKGLPALADGQVYELWTVTQGAVPAGTFHPGDSTSLVSLPDAALQADSIALSVEPAGGSAQPTTDPLMFVTLPA